jgi:hypothetical protein
MSFTSNMSFKYTILFVFLLATSQKVLAQSNGPSSLSPNYSEQTKTSEKTKKKKSGRKITYDARDKFYDRMEQVAKDNRKAEKELQKPQYADPTYFGHKKPPKRRSAGKLKYCKECGIRH